MHIVGIKGLNNNETRPTDQTILFGVDWNSTRNGPIDNPRGWWKSGQRLVRDNHYAEALENLGKRSFSTPDRRYSTVGFRLLFNGPDPFLAYHENKIHPSYHPQSCELCPLVWSDRKS